MTNHKLSIIAGGFFLAFGLAPESAFAYTKCTITAECLIEIRMAKNEINQNIDSFDRSTTRAIDTARSDIRSEEHTSELQSLMRISYAVFCLKKKKRKI